MTTVCAISNDSFFVDLKVVSSAIVDKYIGESARLIREMFGKFQMNIFQVLRPAGYKVKLFTCIGCVILSKIIEKQNN